MFLTRRPSTIEIERFLDRSRTLPLSYGPTGIVRQASDVHRLDEQVVVIGHGEADFERARIALAEWTSKRNQVRARIAANPPAEEPTASKVKDEVGDEE